MWLIAICVCMLTFSPVFWFSLEENEKLVLTPFEKNLDIWRQLWRVLERSDLVSLCQKCINLLNKFNFCVLINCKTFLVIYTCPFSDCYGS